MKKFTIIALLLGSLSMSDLDLNVQANKYPISSLTDVGQLDERKIEILRELNSLKHLASAGNIASNPNLKVDLNDITNSYQKLTQEMKEINERIKMLEESPPGELDVALDVKEEPKVEAKVEDKPEATVAPVAEVAALDTPPAENKVEENLDEKSVEPQTLPEGEVVKQILEAEPKEVVPEAQETLVEEKAEDKVEEPVKEESPAELVENLQTETQAPEEKPKNEVVPENKEEKEEIVPEKKDEVVINEEPVKVQNEQEKQTVVNAPPITAEEPTDFSVTVVLMFVAFTVLFAISKAFENKSPADLGIGGQQQTYGNLFDGGKRAGYSSMSRGSELKSIDNIYNSWSQDKNIGNRQRSSRLIQIDDESVSI